MSTANLDAVDLAFERCLLDSLGRILLTEADLERARAGLLRLESRFSEAPKVAFKHKVTTIVAQNSRRLVSDPDPGVAAAASRLVGYLDSDETNALAHRELLLGEVQRISHLFGERIVVIKGFCNSRFYPAAYTRWMRDIDLLCSSWGDALDLLESLLADGYEFDLEECSWVKADLPRGRDLYGQIFLIKPVGSDFSRVDIHYGTYSVGYAGYLDLGDDLAELHLLPSGVSVNVLAAKHCPMIAQAHALSDGYVAAKDINDFVAMALAGQLNWVQVGVALRAHELHPQAGRLARHALSLYDDAEVVAAAKALLEGLDTARRRTLWQTHNRSWSLRARVNTSFAFRWRRRRGGSRLRAGADALRCYLFYIRRLELAVRTRSPIERVFRSLMAEPNLSAWQLRPDACTLLIDAGVVRELANVDRRSGRLDTAFRSVAPSISVGVIGGEEVVQLGERAFIPTLDLLIPPHHAEVAGRV